MTELDEMKDRIRQLLLQRGVKRASLFGSQVNGRARPDSDVDILVELGEDLDLLEFIGLKQDIEEAIGKKVDLVEFAMIKPALKERILNEQVELI